MMLRPSFALALLAPLAVACSSGDATSDGSDQGTGGDGSAGTTSTGGASGSGGATTGGSAGKATGGKAGGSGASGAAGKAGASGGAAGASGGTSTGGAGGKSGSTGTGGSIGTGGSTATGGSTGTGGSSSASCTTLAACCSMLPTSLSAGCGSVVQSGFAQSCDNALTGYKNAGYCTGMGTPSCTALATCCTTIDPVYKTSCQAVVDNKLESSCASTLSSYNAANLCGGGMGTGGSSGGQGCANLEACCQQMTDPNTKQGCEGSVTAYKASPGGDSACMSLYGAYKTQGLCN